MHLEAGLKGRLHDRLSRGPSTNAAPLVKMCKKKMPFYALHVGLTMSLQYFLKNFVAAEE